MSNDESVIKLVSCKIRFIFPALSLLFLFPPFSHFFSHLSLSLTQAIKETYT